MVVVGHTRKFMVEAEAQYFDIAVQQIPHAVYIFFCWRTHFKTEVCSGSSRPLEAMSWVKEVEMETSVGDPNTLRSITGRIHPNFETMDSNIAINEEKYPDFELP